VTEKKGKSGISDTKIEIRCHDSKTKTDFKRIAADFRTYEDVIKWLNVNYPIFSKMAPVKVVPGGTL
jgi:hypothetical protein